MVYEGLGGMGVGERLAGHWLGAEGEAHAKRASGLEAWGHKGSAQLWAMRGERGSDALCPRALHT